MLKIQWLILVMYIINVKIHILLLHNGHLWKFSILEIQSSKQLLWKMCIQPNSVTSSSALNLSRQIMHSFYSYNPSIEVE